MLHRLGKSEEWPKKQKKRKEIKREKKTAPKLVAWCREFLHYLTNIPSILDDVSIDITDVQTVLGYIGDDEIDISNRGEKLVNDNYKFSSDIIKSEPTIGILPLYIADIITRNAGHKTKVVSFITTNEEISNEVEYYLNQEFEPLKKTFLEKCGGTLFVRYTSVENYRVKITYTIRYKQYHPVDYEQQSDDTDHDDFIDDDYLEDYLYALEYGELNEHGELNDDVGSSEDEAEAMASWERMFPE